MNTKQVVKVVGIGVGLLISSVSVQSATEKNKKDVSIIDIAGHEVPVTKGGLYDRFRSNPPLSVIRDEAPDVDLSWFEGIQKTKVDAGFETYSPNFYYENSRITAVYTADLDRLKALMPAKVLESVEPLQVWPGRGLVALTAYAYHYCDNDSYNEIALSIITSKPSDSSWGPFTLMGQSISKDYWGYVLKLPVDTELARVRGVVGYNLPKWLTQINYSQSNKAIRFEIFDKETGKMDFAIQGEKLKDLSSNEDFVTNSFTNVDAQGKLISGYAVSRQLSHGSTMDDDAIQLTLSNGSFSEYIKSLDLGEMVKYEYVPDFQSALYTPKPLK
ncbi:hypothetical protein [Pseudoalteromonas sp. L21]|uniref:hypothetical protein n=1 Tax=Pseudoalteromonas sp. L21 TaxID=1539746 RepID=UPI001F1BCB9C|nr:hypothetical protein [Pseudoalteromonas sp. L21]MCF7518023.1 hypothetical protein [Pseudoalteromonas sp. L21]